MISSSPPAMLNSEGAKRKTFPIQRGRGRETEIHRIQAVLGPESMRKVSCLQNQGLSVVVLGHKCALQHRDAAQRT